MTSDRYFTGEAIILKYSTTGEINRQFAFISPVLGIQTATAFGAERLKSRFCPSIQNFVSADLFLNKNPKTGLLKLDDISNIDTNDFIKLDLKLIYIVSFFSDILLNTYMSNEEFKSFFYLLKYSIEILKYKNDIVSSFMFFTGKYFLLSGYGLNLNGCRKCKTADSIYYFDFQSHGILCSKCAIDKKYRLSENASFCWKYFFETRYKDMTDLRIDSGDFKVICTITMDILANIFSRELKTFDLIRKIF
jgi:DNA repair protein RecO